MPSTDPLAQAQNDMFVRLKTRLQLITAGVHVEQMRPRENGEAIKIQEAINNSLAGQISDGARVGLAILLPLPGFNLTKPNVPAVMGEMVLKVVVLENIMQNMGPQGTHMTCETAACLVALAGHHFQLADNRLLICDGFDPINTEGQDYSADIAYEVTFRCQFGMQQETECAMPQILIDGSSLMMTCDTEDAQILATFDGSMPWPGNPAAVPVSTTFETPEPGVIIRAVAYRSDRNPSSPAWHITR